MLSQERARVLWTTSYRLRDLFNRGPNRRLDVTPHHEMDGDGGVWRNGTSVSILSLIITPDTCARLQIDRQWLSSTRGRESWQHRVRKASPRQLWRKGLVDFGDMFRVLPLPKALIVESCLDSPRNDPCSDTWTIYGTKIDALLGFPEIESIMKQDRHLSFISFTNPRNSAMAEILYYVVRYCILEVLSRKIAKRGFVSSILEILYVCQRKRGQWLARRIPNNVYGKWGGGQSRGLMAPNSERVQASVPRYVSRNEGGPTPDWD